MSKLTKTLETNINLITQSKTMQFWQSIKTSRTGLIGAIIITIIVSIYPAIKASKMNTVTALKYE